MGVQVEPESQVTLERLGWVQPQEQAQDAEDWQAAYLRWYEREVMGEEEVSGG
jgi:hypothetical protein